METFYSQYFISARSYLPFCCLQVSLGFKCRMWGFTGVSRKGLDSIRLLIMSA